MLQIFLCMPAPTCPLKQFVAHGDYSNIANCWNNKSSKRNISRDIWNISLYLKKYIYLFIYSGISRGTTNDALRNPGSCLDVTLLIAVSLCVLSTFTWNSSVKF